MAGARINQERQTAFPEKISSGLHAELEKMREGLSSCLRRQDEEPVELGIMLHDLEYNLAVLKIVRGSRPPHSITSAIKQAKALGAFAKIIEERWMWGKWCNPLEMHHFPPLYPH